MGAPRRVFVVSPRSVMFPGTTDGGSSMPSGGPGAALAITLSPYSLQVKDCINVPFRCHTFRLYCTYGDLGSRTATLPVRASADAEAGDVLLDCVSR